MRIRYLGKRNISCDMCLNAGTHAYIDSKEWMKSLFPEVEFEDMTICEKCAMRETGKKHWKDVKRIL